MKNNSNKFLLIAIFAVAALLVIPMISTYAHTGFCDIESYNHDNYGSGSLCHAGYNYSEEYYESDLDKEELLEKKLEDRLSQYRNRLEHLEDRGEITEDEKEELLDIEKEYLEENFERCLETNEDLRHGCPIGRHHGSNFGGHHQSPGHRGHGPNFGLRN